MMAIILHCSHLNTFFFFFPLPVLVLFREDTQLSQQRWALLMLLGPIMLLNEWRGKQWCRNSSSVANCEVKHLGAKQTTVRVMTFWENNNTPSMCSSQPLCFLLLRSLCSKHTTSTANEFSLWWGILWKIWLYPRTGTQSGNYSSATVHTITKNILVLLYLHTQYNKRWFDRFPRNNAYDKHTTLSSAQLSEIEEIWRRHVERMFSLLTRVLCRAYLYNNYNGFGMKILLLRHSKEQFSIFGNMLIGFLAEG